jgi:asparagine synthase (glutamine-hydrolysing)
VKRAARLPGSGGLVRLLLQAGGLLAPPLCKALAQRLLGEALMPGWMNAAWFQAREVRPYGPSRWAGPRQAGDLPHAQDILRRQLHQTLVETSLPMLLRYEDRNSMAHSIESRVPFLTPALVSFTLRLPEEYIIAPDGTSKNVFRRAMRDIVPDAVLDRRDKVGFVTPERSWLARSQGWVESVLTSAAAERVPALDRVGMCREWRGILEGRRPFDFRVWRWVNLIRWAERFQVTFEE